ncbi:hypothetical protein TWF569_007360 [Orbilia oligospora]|uniref:Yeast cell wall synthesis Kre9/Knh1-like N-terminal domain-containing protein n=1 Tax=Orbilia oligospora TaxID=2813651 RepID=A0A7C8P6U9_ORBOL|nr:hypothetical protein TWF706_006314 [Orbilia oligospora]KAF3108599.1 hypothetical protein TWF102_010724 [Orbilia oligospora]KAF3111571.1 hypothetical protein TWF103_003515 [Orbilia oligospora]KAF3136133.1 hypothetical protein TWF703_005778 [Orbilia oligospora]KAF3143271.1 hypothetical protein TWF569_007360 [Orbilia oligospora]
MRFSFLSSLLSLAAIAAPFVSAQGAENNENVITKPAAGEVWVAGTPFPIEWTASANPGTVSIVLVKGVPGNLQVLDTIAPNVANNGKFEWTPPLTLEGMQTMAADQVYQFKIVNDESGNFGFSPSFKIDSPASTFAPTGAPANPAEETTSSAAPAETTSETSASSVEPTSTSTEVPTSTETTSEVVSSTSVVESSSEVITSTSVSEAATTSTSEELLTTSEVPTTLSTAVRTSPSSPEPTSEETGSPTESPDATNTSSPSETTSAAPSESSQPSGGLPAGVIAGITGGIIAFLILAIVGVFLFRRSKQQSRTKLRGNTPPPQPSKYDRDFQMMERRARHRPTSSFGFNTSRSDTSGVEGRNDPYVQLGDRDSRRGSETWGASRF